MKLSISGAPSAARELRVFLVWRKSNTAIMPRSMRIVACCREQAMARARKAMTHGWPLAAADIGPNRAELDIAAVMFGRAQAWRMATERLADAA